jgi:hypothetical protein
MQQAFSEVQKLTGRYTKRGGGGVEIRRLEKISPYRISRLSLFNKHSEGDQMKEDEMGQACGTHGGEQRCVQDFGGKTEAKRPLGIPSSRWKNNFHVDI